MNASILPPNTGRTKTALLWATSASTSGLERQNERERKINMQSKEERARFFDRISRFEIITHTDGGLND